MSQDSNSGSGSGSASGSGSGSGVGGEYSTLPAGMAESLGIANLKYLIAVDAEGKVRTWIPEGLTVHYDCACDEHTTTAKIEFGICKRGVEPFCTWKNINGVWMCIGPLS